MINKDNYIEFIVDYFDGNLSDDLQKTLLAFLEENPDCKVEFNNYSAALEDVFTEDYSVAPDFLKTTLKNIPELQADAQQEKLVAYMEDDLSVGERKEVEKALVENSELQRSFYLLEKTRMETEMDVRFPHKSVLKRYRIPPMVRRTMVAVSTAAAVLLLVWNIIVLGKTYQVKQNSISQISVFPSFDNALPIISPINEDEELDTTKKANSSGVIETPGNQESEILQAIPVIAAANQLPLSEYATEGIAEVQTEFMEIYAYNEYKIRQVNSSNNEAPKNKTGTLSQWTNWARQTISGEKTMRDNPANGITLADLSNFGVSTLNRITGADIPLAVR